AMLLRGVQARFTDPATGEVVRPGSLPHQLGDFVMAVVRAGFLLDRIGEHAPGAAFVARYPRARDAVGWPMALVLELRTQARAGTFLALEGEAMDEQLSHYSNKLAYEIDAWDLQEALHGGERDRKSTRLNSSHRTISYAVFCLKKKRDETTGYAI